MFLRILIYIMLAPAVPGLFASPRAHALEYREGDDPVTYCQSAIESGVYPAGESENSVWRCMDGEVWVCVVGANLPCGEKGDHSRTPTQAVSAFCRANPGAQVIPAFITGRATLFEWTCDGDEAAAGRQIFTTDSAGYIAEFWHRQNP